MSFRIASDIGLGVNALARVVVILLALAFALIDLFACGLEIYRH